MRRSGLGGDRAGAPRGEPRRMRDPHAPGHGDRARLRQRRPGGLRAQPARVDRGQRRPPRRRHAAARGGDGGGVRGTRPQRAHARRGLLQPDHGLDQRGRLGPRRRVVRDGGRVRARAGHGAAARGLPHHPRRRTASPGAAGPRPSRRSRAALETHAGFVPAMGAPTVASMAELRVRQGRLAEAEQLLAGREEHPSSLCALARLRIADGRPQVAAALLERALGGAEGDAIRTTQLLAPLVGGPPGLRRPRGRGRGRRPAGRARRGFRHPVGRGARASSPLHS